MRFQYRNLAELISHLNSSGCKVFVVCPGSRNAPIITVLSNLDNCILYNHIDERSAGYFALGIAKKMNEPIAVVCTSGTAALNLAPAMAEAYYQNLCLIAITADRPAHAENSFEAQSINQHQIFNNFVAAQLDLDLSINWDLTFTKSISAKTQIALEKNLPIHVNLRLSEPLYDFNYDSPYKTLKEGSIDSSKAYFTQFVALKEPLSNEVVSKLKQAKKPLLFLGFDAHKQATSSQNNFPVLADACSPNYIDGNIFCFDYFLNNRTNNHALQPDVLISSGTYMLSKNLRNWLKANPPAYHLHLGTQTNFVSPFTHHYEVINCQLNEILEVLNQNQYTSFNAAWQTLETNSKQSLLAKTESFKSSFYAILTTLLSRSENRVLHCGNSMSVRYAALFQSMQKKFDSLIVNRGTSGIDGCMSTFLGYTLRSLEKEWLVIGDVSFFYDCNAFWINELPHNFVIIVINNHKGQIFDVIKGPEKMGNAKNFITTVHKNSVKQIAQLHRIKYYAVNSIAEAEALNFKKKQQKIIEIFDDNPLTVTEYKLLYE